MTIPEASQLVLQAGAMGQGGEIFILDMGEPVKIVDLARDLITLCGLRPMDDIEIRFSGVRPGEKLVEEISTSSEHADKTKHPKVFIGRIKHHDLDTVMLGVDALLDLARATDVDRVREMLCKIVPEFQAARPSRASGTHRQLESSTNASTSESTESPSTSVRAPN
jgi:FlaA1/EpsC-like NDP-sugar epimerase